MLRLAAPTTARAARPFIAALLAIAPLAPSALAAKPTPAPSLPPPDVSLTVEPGPGNHWTLRLRNRSDVALYLAGDARLLTLEITPAGADGSDAVEPAASTAKGKAKGKADKPKGPKVVRCALPPTMREVERVVVLKPGDEHRELFDPRLHCLDQAASALVEGATIRAELGWPAAGKGSESPPFIIGPASSSAAALLASAKHVVAAPRVLEASDVHAASSASASAKASGGDDAPAIDAVAGSAHSVGTGADARVAITIHERKGAAVSIYARPQLLAAEMIDPLGNVVSCGVHGPMPAPIADFLVQLPAKGSWSADASLASMCPAGSLDRPGLYEVWPMLRAPRVPWKPSAFAGVLRAQKPTLIRIERGALPYLAPSPPIAPKAIASASVSAATASGKASRP